MAAEVSRQQIKEESKSGLITRDFLGGCFEKQIESKELDLDLHVPSGWEKRLDLKSGKVYLQRCNSPSAPSEQRNSPNLMLSPKICGLNSNSQQSLMSSSLKPTHNLLEDTSLDLKLVSNCSPSSYTSVCTLDKVKSALDRAERASPSLSSTTSSSSSKKRLMGAPPMVRSPSKSSSSMSNSSSMSFKDVEDEDERWSADQGAGLMVATACPGCLLYVLISKNDPKCPKCNSLVKLPMVTKKPKIDLNMSI